MNESVMDAGQKTEERGLRSRKVRAILAGGLVLGLGAAVTLAAWNDSEFAKGTFTSGSLNIQGSVDGDIFDATTPRRKVLPSCFRWKREIWRPVMCIQHLSPCAWMKARRSPRT